MVDALTDTERTRQLDADSTLPHGVLPNGAALAALLSAGIGAFGVGLVVILNEAAGLSVPALYAPSGGSSGRTAAGVVIWIIAWFTLHNRWKGREIQLGRIPTITLALVFVGIALAFPLVWQLF